ncbi:MAG: DUF2249 domain-containing protein [Opitutaceae bacterium]|nr:DUF2249 domain-containing protein [Opitutaceae bacterium]
MSTTSTQSAEDIFDARELTCDIKRPAVIDRCVNLPVGSSFVLINGHDPVPLRAFLDGQFPGCFRWEHVPGLVDDDAVAIRVSKVGSPVDGFGAPVADFRCH